MVSRIGLPLSIVSARAIFSRFCSIASAILLRIFALSVGLVLPQASFAACAASRAKLTSASDDLATSQNGLPVKGVIFSKYFPSTGFTHFPPM